MNWSNLRTFYEGRWKNIDDKFLLWSILIGILFMIESERLASLSVCPFALLLACVYFLSKLSDLFSIFLLLFSSGMLNISKLSEQGFNVEPFKKGTVQKDSNCGTSTPTAEVPQYMRCRSTWGRKRVCSVLRLVYCGSYKRCYLWMVGSWNEVN